MTVADELKTIAFKARHAFEELAINRAYTEANQLYSGGAVAMWVYLKQRYGGPTPALKAIRAMLREVGEPTPKINWKSSEDRRIEKHRIRVEQSWVFEEATYQQKYLEAKATFSKLNDMLAYIKEFYGADLLPQLRIAAQRPRRKTSGEE